jgi:hypothetical protein
MTRKIARALQRKKGKNLHYQIIQNSQWYSFGSLRSRTRVGEWVTNTGKFFFLRIPTRGSLTSDIYFSKQNVARVSRFTNNPDGIRRINDPVDIISDIAW